MQNPFQTWTSLDDLKRWYGIDDVPWAAFHLQIGQPDLLFSAMPGEALTENIMRRRCGTPPGFADIDPCRPNWSGMALSRADHVHQGWGQLQRVQGHRPLGHPAGTSGNAGSLASSPSQGKSDKDVLVDRPVRRQRVCAGEPCKSRRLVPALPKDYGRHTARRRRLHCGTTFGAEQESSHSGSSALRVLNPTAGGHGAGGYMAKELPGPASWSRMASLPNCR